MNNLKTWKTTIGVFWYSSARPRAFSRFAQWLIWPFIHCLYCIRHKLNMVEGKLFSLEKHNNKESSTADRFERLNFEQLLSKSILRSCFLQDFIKNNTCKVSRARARDQDRNPSRPKRDLRHSRPRLEKTRLETETKSRDSITEITSLSKRCQSWATYSVR